MAPKRAAKRARVEATAGKAAATSVAGPSGDQAQNAFDALPDELVLHIMSLVGLREVWEVSRLQQVDQRFRRLVHGMEWEELRLENEDGVRATQEPRMKRYKSLLDRMTERVRRGDLKGARGVRVSLFHGYIKPVFKPPATALAINIADSVLHLAAALAVAPVPLERVDLGGSWVYWPNDDERRKAGLKPRTLNDVASRLLIALSPARALRALSATRGMARAAAEACIDLPPSCVPGAASLRELKLVGHELSQKHVAALVRAWPALRRVDLSVQDGAALGELARLPSLEALAASFWGSEQHLDPAIVAVSGAAGAATRLRELWFRVCYSGGTLLGPEYDHAPVLGARAVAASLSLRSLQRLSFGVDSASAEAIGGLAALERLRELNLVLRLSESEDRAAALLAAAAAALERARALDRLCLNIDNKAGLGGSPPVGARLATLLCAARPTLMMLFCNSGLASPEFLREIALCGPKLRYVSLEFALPDSAADRDFSPFHELVSLSPDRLPAFKLGMCLKICKRLASWSGILESWFRAVPSIECRVLFDKTEI